MFEALSQRHAVRMVQLNVVRSSDARVQAARTATHAARLEYNALRERLKRERRRRLADALRDMRHVEHAAWRAAHRTMHRTLRRQFTVEAAALQRHFGAAAVPPAPAAYLPYTLYSADRGGMEPTRRSFWTL